MAASFWLVTWEISQSGSEAHGNLGIYKTKQAAAVAALQSIHDNWVQGNWSEYDKTTIRSYCDLIRTGKFEAAVEFWSEHVRSNYRVELEEHVIQPRPLLTLALFGLPEYRTGHLLNGGSVCNWCVRFDEYEQSPKHKPGEEYKCARCATTCQHPEE